VRGEIVARNYAQALFALGDREHELEAFGAALSEVAALLEEHADVRSFLETPRIATAEKKRVLRESLEGRIPGLVLNFILLVLDKRRQRLLPGMAQAYRDLLDERLGRAHVDVHVARSLTDDEVERIRSRLSSILEKDAIPHIRIRPELIGGIAFRSGDMIFDGSVRRRLQSMRRRLMAADVSMDPDLSTDQGQR